MIRHHLLCLSIALACVSTSAQAADFADPTWPCVQRKVARLSLGLMWPHPVEETATFEEHTSEDMNELADTLALRRVNLEDMETPVAEFVATHGGDSAILGQVFARVFESLSGRRTRIMDGIGNFSLSQIALSEKIDAARLEMTAALSAEEQDFDRIDALEEQLDWDQLIYSDRQKSITYLCETPTLLEKRLFGVAQLLQRHLTSTD